MKKETLLLILANLALLAVIFVILDMLNIVTVNNPFSSKKQEPTISNDSLLLQKDSLKKQWVLLSAKENYINQQKSKIKNKEILLSSKIKELNKQIALNKSIQEKVEEDNANKSSQDQNLRSLASKISSVPPLDGAAMLADMEPTTAVETVKMMDKMAVEQGKKSTTAYLLSLMKPEKRKEIINLLSNYPSEVDLDE